MVRVLSASVLLTIAVAALSGCIDMDDEPFHPPSSFSPTAATACHHTWSLHDASYASQPFRSLDEEATLAVQNHSRLLVVDHTVGGRSLDARFDYTIQDERGIVVFRSKEYRVLANTEYVGLTPGLRDRNAFLPGEGEHRIVVTGTGTLDGLRLHVWQDACAQ